MPQTRVLIYCDEKGGAPLINLLRRQPAKVQDKCYALVERLQEQGHQLRRPTADYLDKGIYELRPKFRGVQYRIFYCFVGQNQALLTHGSIKKENRVAARDIERALKHRTEFRKNPSNHTYSA